MKARYCGKRKTTAEFYDSRLECLIWLEPRICRTICGKVRTIEEERKKKRGTGIRKVASGKTVSHVNVFSSNG